MHKCVRQTFFAVAAVSAASCAQADDLQNLFRALGSAVGQQVTGQPTQGPQVPVTRSDDGPPTGNGFNHVGRNVDTPENLNLLNERVRARIESADPGKTNDFALMQLCKEEMQPLKAYEMVIGTGYDELRAKCETAAAEPIREFQARQTAQLQQQRESEAAAASARAAEKKAQEDREYAAAMAELRAGKRQPVNCEQWVAAKGQDPRTLNAPITKVAYQVPHGQGYYTGRVERINGDTMLLSDQPIIRMRDTPQGYMVVTVARAKVFNAEQIRVGTVVDGFATQTGSRTLKMTDGSAQQAPVLLATCMNGMF